MTPQEALAQALHGQLCDDSYINGPIARELAQEAMTTPEMQAIARQAAIGAAVEAVDRDPYHADIDPAFITADSNVLAGCRRVNLIQDLDYPRTWYAEGKAEGCIASGEWSDWVRLARLILIRDAALPEDDR